MSDLAEERGPSWRTTRGLGIDARLRAYRIGERPYVKTVVSVKTGVDGIRTGDRSRLPGALNVPSALSPWASLAALVELVERRPSPEGERPGKKRIGEYLDQGTADDQVLLDLEILAPRRPLPPLGDVVPRDHASVSMLAFTNSRQSFDRRAPSASAPGRRFPDDAPFVYRPFAESGAVYRWIDEVGANLKDNDLLDLGT